MEPQIGERVTDCYVGLTTEVTGIVMGPPGGGDWVTTKDHPMPIPVYLDDPNEVSWRLDIERMREFSWDGYKALAKERRKRTKQGLKMTRKARTERANENINKNKDKDTKQTTTCDDQGDQGVPEDDGTLHFAAGGASDVSPTPGGVSQEV